MSNKLNQIAGWEITIVRLIHALQAHSAVSDYGYVQCWETVWAGVGVSLWNMMGGDHLMNPMACPLSSTPSRLWHPSMVSTWALSQIPRGIQYLHQKLCAGKSGLLRTAEADYQRRWTAASLPLLPLPHNCWDKSSCANPSSVHCPGKERSVWLVFSGVCLITLSSSLPLALERNISCPNSASTHLWSFVQKQGYVANTILSKLIYNTKRKSRQ